MKNLKLLWLNENKIKTIEGLGGCPSLENLNLHSNSIEKIENLDSLSNLSTLILSENSIKTIENLEHLNNLQSFNIAMNLIESVGNGFDNLSMIEDINLSGNKLCHIDEILKLKEIKTLKKISFFDPHFGGNPFCNIYNYQTFMFYHFSHLEKFDNLVINQESKSCAEIEFKKKQIYYNMKIKALKRLFITIQKLLKSAKTARKDVLNQGIKLMKQFSLLKGAENRLTKEKAFKVYLLKSEEEIYLEETYEKVVEHLRNELNRHIYFISKELESTGNFKLEEGAKSERWFQSCINLVKSRFNPDDFQQFNIEDLNVFRVLRIHNRFLRNRFEERIELYLDQSKPNYKKSFEYLFYGVDPNHPGEFWNIVEHGYRYPEECKKKGICPYIPLVNSVAAADMARIQRGLAEKLRERQSCIFGDALKDHNQRISSGYILVCKVIIVRPQQDPRFPMFEMDKSFSESYDTCPLDDSLLSSDIVASFREAKEDTRHKVWFIHDNTLALPEYLITFDYETKEQTTSCDSFYVGDHLLTSLDHELKFAKPHLDSSSIDNREHALQVSINEIKKRHKANFGSKDTASVEMFNHSDIARSGISFMKLDILNFMMLCAAEDHEVRSFKDKLQIFTKVKRELENENGDVESIVSVNYSSYGLTALQSPLSSFPNLINVDLSFNQLSDYSFLEGSKKIEVLCLAGNLFKTVGDLSFLEELADLDISYNKITDINTLKILTANKKLLKLKARGNLIYKKFAKPTIIIMKFLPQISYLDERSLDQLRVEEKSRPSVKLDSNQIQDKVNTNLQSLSLTHDNIVSLGDVKGLGSLTELDLSWNRLIKLNGIEALEHLRVFKAENNLLKDISSIAGLKELRQLELGSNYIKEIGQSFKNLTRLTHLSLEANRIELLEGFNYLPELLELYIGENYVSDLKQVRHFSGLKKLIVIDLWGNPLCRESHYRLYVIFQINDIKVLDGSTVIQTEKETAREEFKGRLSEELLEAKLKGQKLKSLKSLNLSKCKLRDFDSVFTSDKFPVVQEINLTGNQFTCFKSFKNLPALKILLLSENKLNTLEPIANPKFKVGLNAFPVTFISYPEH